MKLATTFLILFVLFNTGQAFAEDLYTLRDMAGQAQLFSIDLSTGVITPSVATGVTMWDVPASAFDSRGRRFFFISSNSLHIINIAQGTVSHQTHTMPGQYFPELEYNSSTGRLYTLLSVAGQAQLFSIDPSTGVITSQVATGVTTWDVPASAFDPIAQRFFFISSNQLHIINIINGTVTHITHSMPGQYFPQLEFDPSVGKLYTLFDMAGEAQLFSIDITSGNVTPVIATGVTTWNVPASAFDPVGRRFFFSSSDSLHVVDVAHLTVSHELLSPSGQYFPLLKFDAQVTVGAPMLSPYALTIVALILAILALRSLQH